MHPQLQAVVDDFGRAETRLHRLAATVATRPLADTVAEFDEWQRRQVTAGAG